MAIRIGSTVAPANEKPAKKSTKPKETTKEK